MMVGRARFELAVSWSQTRRFTELSYRPIPASLAACGFRLFGTRHAESGQVLHLFGTKRALRRLAKAFERS